MADVFIGVNIGDSNAAVTTGASTTGKDIEIVIDDSKLARGAVDADSKIRIAIEQILLFIESDFDY